MPPATPHFPNDFPRRLARLRELLGLTWKGLARGAGVLVGQSAGVRPHTGHLVRRGDVERAGQRY